MLLGGTAFKQRLELTERIDHLHVQSDEVRVPQVAANSSGLAYQASWSRTFDQRFNALFESATAQRVTLRSLSATHESPDPQRLRSVRMDWSAQGSYAALRRWQIDLQQGDPFIAMLNLQLRSQTRDGAGEAVEARMSWVMYETP